MKKQLALAAGLAVLATPAFATKARLNALGEDQYGSFYVQDNRNMFLNAAHVNSYKDFATMEYGSAGTNATADTIGAPQAEGGVFMGHGNLVYGAYFGNKSNTSAAFRSWASTNVNQSNTTDIFVGGDAGIKWGANLSYSKSDEVKSNVAGGTVGTKQQALSTRLGVNGGNWQAFANISLSNKAEDGTEKFKGKTGYQVGGSYMLNDYTLFGEYRSFKGEETTADVTAKVSIMNVGAGRQTKLNDKATLFTKASVLYAKGENDSATNMTISNDITSVVIFGNDNTTKYTAVPVVAGLEYDAASWLTLRGSVSQILWNKAEYDGDETGALNNFTVVRAGAGLKFGDWNIDGVVGNDNNGSTQGSNTGSGNGSLRTDQLMSRVAVSYKW